jgi:hypothetical protein
MAEPVVTILDAVDAVLDTLLRTQVSRLRATGATEARDEQVGFQPPNQTWSSAVDSLVSVPALNVYLVDLVENVELRSSDVLREPVAGQVREHRAPVRVDCHYLITAWSPAKDLAARASIEHALLFQVMEVLFRRSLLVPGAVFGRRERPPGFPPDLVDTALPIAVAPSEGFPKLAEFWGTMGDTQAWKPAVHLVVTIPVAFPAEAAAAPVTTRVVRYRTAGGQDGGEPRIAIGGRVLDATQTPPVALSGAWVRLESPAGEPHATTRTDASGRFVFGDLAPGDYQLRWRAGPRPEPNPRPVTVPSPTGDYDLEFV